MSVFYDLKYAIRALRNRPAFALSAILTLALGVAATTVVFSVVDSILLIPVPFRDPDRLVEIFRWGPTGGGPMQPTAMLPRWRERKEIFEQVEAHWEGSFALTGDTEPEVVYGSQVTLNLFRFLGVSPLIGRDFAPHESEERVALISHGLWSRRFGEAPNVIGRSLRMNDDVFTIIGVMPHWFNFPVRNVHVWIPFDPLQPNPQSPRRAVTPIARLQKDVSLKQADDRVALLAPQMDPTLARPGNPITARLQPMDRYGQGSLLTGNYFIKDRRTALFLVLGAAGLVLLATCANSANLFLSRAVSRTREIAVRVAVGGGRLRLARYMLTEAIVLALLAGLIGLTLAAWIMQGLTVVMPADLIEPALSPIEVNGRAAMWAIAASLVSGVIASAIPTLTLVRGDITAGLKATSNRQAGGHSRLRGILLSIETAIAVVLMVGAGLMARSLWGLVNLDTGWSAEDIVIIEPQFRTGRYAAPAGQTRLIEDVSTRLRAIPEIAEVAMAQAIPLLPNITHYGSLESEDSTIPEAAVTPNRVSPDYFRTLGLKFYKGRTFQTFDAAGPEPAIVTRQMAEKLWTGEDPLGKRFRMEGSLDWLTVIGVVQDVQSEAFDSQVEPFEFYRPLSLDAAGPPPQYLAVRTTGRSSIVERIRALVRQIDADLPVEIRPLDDIYKATLATPRFHAMLIGGLALLTALLAVAGLYSVVSYEVSRRTHEFGIRIALGARGGSVIRQVMVRSLTAAAAGLLAGLAISLALTRLMSSMLYAVQPGDPLTFAGSALLLLGASSFACFVPARHASRIDPIVALRCE